MLDIDPSFSLLSEYSLESSLESSLIQLSNRLSYSGFSTIFSFVSSFFSKNLESNYDSNKKLAFDWISFLSNESMQEVPSIVSWRFYVLSLMLSLKIDSSKHIEIVSSKQKSFSSSSPS